MLGSGSVQHFSIVSAGPGRAQVDSLIEVEQVLDLSAATPSGRACLRIKGEGGGVTYCTKEFRVTLSRYGALRVATGVRLGDLVGLDCDSLFDENGAPMSSSSLMLLFARGHGTSGSIQLVSRSLGERLLRAFPSIYQA